MNKTEKSIIDSSLNFNVGAERHNYVHLKEGKKRKRKKAKLDIQHYNINYLNSDPTLLINEESVKNEKPKKKRFKSSSSNNVVSKKLSNDDEELNDLGDEEKQSDKNIISKQKKRKRKISSDSASEVVSEERRSLEEFSKQSNKDYFKPMKIKKSMSMECDESEKMNSICTKDDAAADNFVLKKCKKKRKHKEKKSRTEDLSRITSQDDQNLHSNEGFRIDDVIIKEEYITSYPEYEENLQNKEVTSNLEIDHFKNETERLSNFVDESLMEKLKSNKRSFANSSSSSDTSIEDSDGTNFEEAFKHCSSSREKSQLVEKKKLQKDREELTWAEIGLLKQLKIQIPWPIPICHSIETRVSSYPTKQQKEQFAGLQIKFASGPYSKEEDAKIKENWSNFCESHGLEENPKLFLTFMWEGQAYLHKQERINFVRYLAKDLKHRPLWSIYGRFQLIFSNTQKGNFTRKEDDMIMAFYENSDFPNKNSALAAVLNRNRASIKNRYNILKAEDSKTKFNDEMDQELVDNLMEVSGKTRILDLEDVQFDINKYKEISSKMKIHFTKLRRRWEQVLKPGLFVKEYTFLQEIREKMIDLLIESKLTDRREINWKQLAKHFDNVTSSKLYKIFTDVVCSYVPEHHQKSLPEIMNCLKHAKNHMVNKKLKKFNYEGRNLIF